MKGFFAVATAAVSLLAAVGSVSADRMQHKKRTSYTDRMTWFNLPSGNDACGAPLTEGASYVHVSKDIWNNGKNCGQWMSITVNGRESYGMVSGSCAGCTSKQIDTSPALFEEWDNLDTGILTAAWHFMKAGWTPPDAEDC